MVAPPVVTTPMAVLASPRYVCAAAAPGTYGKSAATRDAGVPTVVLIIFPNSAAAAPLIAHAVLPSQICFATLLTKTFNA